METMEEDSPAERSALLRDAEAAYFPDWDGRGGATDFVGGFHFDPSAICAVIAELPDVTLRALAKDLARLSGAARLHVARTMQDLAAVGTGGGPSDHGAPSLRSVADAFALTDTLGAFAAIDSPLGPERLRSILGAFELRSPVPEAERAARATAGLLSAAVGTRLDAAAYLIRGQLIVITGQIPAAFPPATLEAIRRHIRAPHRVLAVLKERRSIDPDVIVPLLDAAADPLSTGML